MHGKTDNAGSLREDLRQRDKRGGSSYLARALVLHVGHDLGKGILGLGGVVGTLVEGDDILPVLDNLLRGQGHVDGEAVAAGALPPGGTNPAAADFVEAASGVLGNLVAAESKDKRSNVVGLEGLDELLGEDGLGHGGTSVGGDGVDEDVVLGTLEGDGTGEAKDGAFLETQSQLKVHV